MPVWPIKCGSCGDKVSADVVAGCDQQGHVSNTMTLWLKCPACGEGSVKVRGGAVFPVFPSNGTVQYLPTDVDEAWREARLAHAVAAYTATEMMCRKILMHVAVDKAGSTPGKNFVQYVDDLESTGYITTGLKAIVDQIRQRGNIANHDLPASTEDSSKQILDITEYLLRGVYELPGPLTPAVPPTPTP